MTRALPTIPILDVEVTAPIPAVAWKLRTPRASDQGYIASTWLKSLRRAPEYARAPRGEFFAQVGPLIDRVLDRDDTACFVAAAEADPDEVWGWLVYTPVSDVLVLHFAYVRSRHRGKGVARALAVYAGFHVERSSVFTFRGPDAKGLAKKYPNAIHMPIEEFLS